MKMKIRQRLWQNIGKTILLATLFWFYTQSGAANTLHVTSAVDDGGVNTLRSVVQQANGDPPGDIIVFDSTFSTITINAGSEIVIQQDMTICGPGATNLTIIGVNPHDRVFEIKPYLDQNNHLVGVTVTISNLTFTGGYRGLDGQPGTQQNPAGLPGQLAAGGIIFNNHLCSLTLSNCIMEECYAIGGNGGLGFGGVLAPPGNGGPGADGLGGAIWTKGTLTVYGCTFRSNSAAGGNGGAGTNASSSFDGSKGGDGGVGRGGAIYVEYLGDSPALAAINCTFFDNLALGGRGGRGGTGLQAAHGGDGGNGGSVAGGAVYHADINCMAPDCGSMIHCTVSQNYLLPGRGGDGGIGNINGNQGLDGSGSGGGLFLAPTKYLVGNTIIAGDGCLGAAACSAPDVWGKVISLKYNLIGALDGNSSGWDNAAGAKDRTGMVGNPLDPRLGPLQNNGGETPTLAPLAGSPAIDAGIEDGVPLDKVDQAGQPRRVIVVGISNGGDGSDIGAYELQCSPNVPTLSIARFGNNLILSWPWPSKCFVLQQTSDLTMPNWMDAQYPVNVVGNQNQVVIAQPMGNLFFRFKK